MFLSAFSFLFFFFFKCPRFTSVEGVYGFGPVRQKNGQSDRQLYCRLRFKLGHINFIYYVIKAGVLHVACLWSGSLPCNSGLLTYPAGLPQDD